MYIPIRCISRREFARFCLEAESVGTGSLMKRRRSEWPLDCQRIGFANARKRLLMSKSDFVVVCQHKFLATLECFMPPGPTT
jgi:hypothetical protein